jgi:hypothetical protein
VVFGINADDNPPVADVQQKSALSRRNAVIMLSGYSAHSVAILNLDDIVEDLMSPIAQRLTPSSLLATA